MAPSTDVGGECANQGPLCRLLGVGDEVMQLRALSRQSRATGSNEGFEPQEASLAIFARCGVPHRVLANVKAKKGEPWLAVGGLQGMRDPRLPGRERQPQRAGPAGGATRRRGVDSALSQSDLHGGAPSRPRRLPHWEAVRTDDSEVGQLA